MKKAPDILAAKMIPRSPKNNFSKKQTIVLILKKNRLIIWPSTFVNEASHLQSKWKILLT